MKRRQGYTDGVKWAREWATGDELRDFVLEDWALGEGGDFQGDHTIVDFCADKQGEHVVSVRLHNDAYGRGFRDGTIVVFGLVSLPV